MLIIILIIGYSALYNRQNIMKTPDENKSLNKNKSSVDFNTRTEIGHNSQYKSTGCQNTIIDNKCQKINGVV